MDDIKLPKNPFLMSDEEYNRELQEKGFSSKNEWSNYSTVIKVLYSHPNISEEDFKKISRIRTKSQYLELIKKYNIEDVLKTYSNLNMEEKMLFTHNVDLNALKILQSKYEKAEKNIEERNNSTNKNMGSEQIKYNSKTSNNENPFKNVNPFKNDEQELTLEAKEKGFDSIEEQECYEDIIDCCIKFNPNITLNPLNWDLFKTKEQQDLLIKKFGYEEILNQYLKMDSDARLAFRLNAVTKNPSLNETFESDYKRRTHK